MRITYLAAAGAAVLTMLSCLILLSYVVVDRNEKRSKTFVPLTESSVRSFTTVQLLQCAIECACSRRQCAQLPHTIAILSSNPVSAAGVMMSIARTSRKPECMNFVVVTRKSMFDSMQLAMRDMLRVDCCRSQTNPPLIVAMSDALERVIRNQTRCIIGKRGMFLDKYRAPENWARFYLHEILPKAVYNERPVLVLDDDVIAISDIQPVLDSPLGNHIAAISTRSGWALDANVHRGLFNAAYRARFGEDQPDWNNESLVGGVMMLDLKRWGTERQHLGHVEYLLSRQCELRREGFTLFQLGTLVPLNYALHKDAARLPVEYNYPGFGYVRELWPPLGTLFIQFNGKFKPWLPLGYHQDYFLQNYPREYILCSSNNARAMMTQMCINASAPHHAPQVLFIATHIQRLRPSLCVAVPAIFCLGANDHIGFVEDGTCALLQ